MSYAHSLQIFQGYLVDVLWFYLLIFWHWAYMVKTIPETCAHHIRYNVSTFYYYHCVHTSVGWLLVPDGIISPVFSSSPLTWFIRYINYWPLLNNVIIIKTKVDPSFLWKCLYQVRAIAVFPVFRLLTNFVCLLTYEFCISLWKIARCSVILLLPLFPKAWVILSDFDLSCQCPFVFLLPKTFKLFGFPISGLWVYPKKGY